MLKVNRVLFFLAISWVLCGSLGAQEAAPKSPETPAIIIPSAEETEQILTEDLELKKEVEEVETKIPVIQRKIAVFFDPSILVEVQAVENFEQLKVISECLLQAASTYDRFDLRTLIPIVEIYLDKVAELENKGGAGFSGLMEIDRQAERVQAEFEPIKQEVLNYFALQLLATHLNRQEVFHSLRLLVQMVKSGQMDVQTQRSLLDAIVKIHVQVRQNIPRFLNENVVRPVLEGNEVLRAEYREKLGKDVVSENLFSKEDMSAAFMAQLKSMMGAKGVKGAKPGKGAMDLVEAREGVVEGKVELDPKKRTIAEAKLRAALARKRARGWK